MNKMWLIAQREYLTRVRNKTFLLSTFLLPVVFILFIAGAVLIQLKTKTRNHIAVVDANGFFKDYLKGDSALTFEFSAELDTTNYEQRGCTAVLIIPKLSDNGKTDLRLKYKKSLGLEQTSALDDHIRDAITDHMIFEKTAVSRSTLDSIRKEAPVATVKSYEDNGKTAKAASQTSAYLIGYISGILIYLLTFIYGAAVMRGVMEEKTNRIAEVMISSVRPFELMWGKITGIGAVGLTQFILWVVLLVAIGFIAQGVIPHDALETASKNAPMGGGAMAMKTQASGFNFSNFMINTNMALVIFCFLFYFIGGYLFYSALFAAVGSAVNEDPQEAQSLMLPITLPVIFSFVIMTVVVQDPSGPLATWASIIPFSSPIVMMARIPSGVPGTVPYWQLGLSMCSLILGFLGTTWLAGKIYRTGILMYGKKASWKVMWKWAFRS